MASFIRNFGRIKRVDARAGGWSAAAAFFLAVLHQSVVAQEAEIKTAKYEVLEEVIVIAPRTLGSMRVKILMAENDVVSLFNAINDDNDYDIHCRRETPVGSNIPRRTCRPGYAERLERIANQNAMNGAGYFEPVAELRQHDRVLQEKLQTLGNENPALYEAMTEYYLLKTEYDAAREERFDRK